MRHKPNGTDRRPTFELLESRLAPGNLLITIPVPEARALASPRAETAIVEAEFKLAKLTLEPTVELASGGPLGRPAPPQPPREALVATALEMELQEASTRRLEALDSAFERQDWTRAVSPAVSLIPQSPVNGTSGTQSAMSAPPTPPPSGVPPTPPPPGSPPGSPPGAPGMPPGMPTPNMPPMTHGENYAVQHDTTLTVDAAHGVLANDFDPEGAQLTAILVMPTQHGSLQLSPDGSFVWTPEAEFSGSDMFMYQASDGPNQTPAQVVVLFAMNTAAMPFPDAYIVAAGSTLRVDSPGVLINDGLRDEDGDGVEDPDSSIIRDVDHDQLKAKVKTTTANGQLVLHLDGHFQYTPNAGFVGVDMFTYWADDGVKEQPTDIKPEQTVMIAVREPTIDIDTDSNNNGAIEMMDDPADGPVGLPFEEQQPGNILWLNNTDDNGNGDPDLEDGGPFTNPEGVLVTDVELEPAILSINADMVPMEDWTVVIHHDPSLRLWNDAQKQAFSSLEFAAMDDPDTEDDNPMPTTIYVEGLAIGPGHVWVELRDSDGIVIDVDLVTFTVVRFELSVNGDNDLDDPGDLAERYVPGYYLDQAEVSHGDIWIIPGYIGQQMRLVLEGLGASPNIEKVTFHLTNSSQYAGFAMNKSDPAVEGMGRAKDYSFAASSDDDEELGTMLSDRTIVDLYAKDYAGFVTATLVIEAAGGGLTHSPQLAIPLDADADGLADLWERRHLPRDDSIWGWETQFADSVTTGDLEWYSANTDGELRDPDATNTDGGHDMPPHLQPGEGLSAWEEYRGYILDGGSFGFQGGHKRLLPWYKEFLVQVDMMDVPAPVPMPSEGEIRSIMNVTAEGMGDLTDGAGLAMFWVLDEVAATPHLGAEQYSQLRDWGLDHINSDELVDFHYVAFVDSPAVGATAVGETPDPRMSFVFVTTTDDLADNLAVPFHGALSSTIAHELTHQLAFDAAGRFLQNPAPGFDTGGHVVDPDPTDPPLSALDDKFLMSATGANTLNLQSIIYDDTTRQQIVVR